jgi:hypothetical protein
MPSIILPKRRHARIVCPLEQHFLRFDKRIHAAPPI